MRRRAAAYLDAMGIDLWRLRAGPAPATASSGPSADSAFAPEPARPAVPVPAPMGRVAETPASGGTANLDWDPLRRAVAACTACALHAGRTQTVFGVGDPHAQWLFIGEAPGAEEDRQGEPFVGRAGQLLNAMLFALGKKREQVYIANVLKCRPPNNRDPLPAEAHACRPFLQRQITLIAPRIIVALGRIAAQRLLDTETPIGRLRGRIHHHESDGRRIPVVVTYHPAYLLRSPREKAKAWADLQLAQQASMEPAP